MSIKKQYSEKKPLCKVTFKIAKEVVGSVKQISLAGDFNNWNVESIPMKKLKTGEFSVSVDLETGNEYQFKYLLDGKDWMNDEEADNYVPNGFCTENSVIIV
jgi:1,4-alpha-glucan branching enzyme